MLVRNLPFAKVKQSLSHKKITFLVGARQVGKTTLMKHLQSQTKNSAYINCDDMYTQVFKNGSDFIEYICFEKKLMNNSVNTFFLGEVQSIKNISLLLKNIYDNTDLKIIASGSGSLEIFRGIGDSLVGRKEIIHMYPLSFEEYITSLNKNMPQRTLSPNLIEAISKHADTYLMQGGYPEVVKQSSRQKTIQTIKDIYNDYLQRDIKEYLTTEDIVSFQKYYALVATSIGSLQKIDALKQMLNIHRTKVEKYNFLLEHTFITHIIPPFVTNPQKEITSHKKIYFHDVGFVNQSYNNFEPIGNQKGKIIENFVCNEIIKNKTDLQELFFWRKKSQVEIDFIIKDSLENTLIPIEVKTKSTDNIPLSFKSFYRDYGKHIKYFVVANKDVYTEREFEGKKVFFVPFWWVSQIILNPK